MARFTPHPAPLLSPWVTTALGRSTTVTWSKGGETATPKIWDEGVSMNGGTAEPLDKKRRKKNGYMGFPNSQDIKQQRSTNIVI